MQLPNAAMERFIFFASFNLTPSDPDLATLSDPAKSTIVKVERVTEEEEEVVALSQN